ncbi:MAG: hypothetical protein C7B47_12325 [Sulfobacillus thermosulfidooxidans]|uniref:Uncharacterized protein n=1 Tax=Sulfobacillus thermosulfidooxidans TaxID=28034 RepID=A0A2T2WT64_SULTH|nr:MAG: hypothetical protein C7B47_12325 [Sulfobacillus thermosulfidooxidans]
MPASEPQYNAALDRLDIQNISITWDNKPVVGNTLNMTMIELPIEWAVIAATLKALPPAKGQ